jgi:hypothetical protein
MSADAPRDGKHYRYRITKIVGCQSAMKIGDVLVYPRAYGPTRHETIVNVPKRTIEIWEMEYVGPCWVEGGKVVRTKDAAPRATRHPV